MKKNKKQPFTFTLLTACKDEVKDIHLAIESALAQTYPHKEIIFVDDSTDGTKEIIRKYQNRGVILLDGPGKGCCEARNLAMKKATGDVIVFLTADTKLNPDYLEKIYPYYQNGADMVYIESESFNLENLYARFLQMQHLMEEGKSSYRPTTTQGYSCRREAALAVGLITGDYPVKFCRDWSLGEKLDKAGYKRVFDRTIIVPHKSPDNFKEYWDTRKTRGRFSALQPYFMFNKPLWFLMFKFIAKDIIDLLRFLTVVSAVVRVARISSYSKHPYRDFFPFFYAYVIQVLARIAGEWGKWFWLANFARLKRKKIIS